MATVAQEDSLWVKWVHGVYMKNNFNIWSHIPPLDSSWYWRKLNGLKAEMQTWYSQGTYILTPDGHYSISSSYVALLGHQSRLETAGLIWGTSLQPKHRFIVWLAEKRRLLTKDRLLRLHIPVDNAICCLGEDQVMETHQHLFSDCEWIKRIRAEMNQWSGVDIPTRDAKQVMEAIKRKYWKQFQKELIAALWGAVLYHVWRNRNWKIFRGSNVNTGMVITQIKQDFLIKLDLVRISKKGQRSRQWLERFFV